MPTGYTAGIMDGSIQTFQEFATICMRAFGACVHLKDEDPSTPYTPRVPSDYYHKQIVEYQKQLLSLEKMDLSKYTMNKLKTLRQEIKRIEGTIKKRDEQRIILLKMLEEVKIWTPPTSKHKEFKEFMINQLVITINSDCNTSYLQGQIESLKERIINFSPKKEIEEEINDIKHWISHLKKERDADVKRCRGSNKWVEDLLKSIEK